MLGLGVVFGLAPTRVFLAVDGDVIQISALLMPVVIALMVLLATTDLGYDGPIPENVAKRLSDKRFTINQQLGDAFRSCFALALLGTAAKFLCTWFIGRGWPAWIIDHLAAWHIGGMAGLAVIRSRGLLDTYGFLLMGRDLSFLAKSHPSRHPPGSPAP